MNILIFDTETTGLPKGDVNHPDNPWPVQIGAMLCDENLTEMSRLNTLVTLPVNVNIHPAAERVHGISREMIDANGAPMDLVFDAFENMVKKCDVISAYNLPFDERVMDASFRRFHPRFRVEPLFDGKDKLCIMDLAMQHLRSKTKLEVAYRKLVGGDLLDAHDAFADVLAARDVLAALLLSSELA